MQGVRVWTSSLDRAAGEAGRLFELLSPVERSRAARFHNERDRRRFVVARGTLRTLLGDHAGLAPERVPITTQPGGKPVLAVSDSIHFNVSHCGELALFAIADREIGIDLERLNQTNDIARVAAHFFAPEESAAFERLDEPERARFFFRTWVRKEAYLKASGKGFAIDPAKVRISEFSREGITVEDENGARAIDHKHAIHDIPGIAGHAAAIAIAYTASSTISALPSSLSAGREECWRVRSLTGIPATMSSTPTSDGPGA